MNKNTVLLYITTLLLLTTSLYFNFRTITTLNTFDYLLIHSREEILNNMVNNSSVVGLTKIRGLYSPTNNIYCAYTDYSGLKQKYETDCHEYLHSLVSNGTCINDYGNSVSCRQHFCGE